MQPSSAYPSMVGAALRKKPSVGHQTIAQRFGSSGGPTSTVPTFNDRPQIQAPEPSAPTPVGTGVAASSAAGGSASPVAQALTGGSATGGGGGDAGFRALLARLGYAQRDDDNALGPKAYMQSPGSAPSFFGWGPTNQLVASVGELTNFVNTFGSQLSPVDKALLYQRFVQAGPTGHRPLYGSQSGLEALGDLLGY